jgi:transcriptional regulator with XRE-family HTH domain
MPYGTFCDISGRIRQVRGKLKKSEFADFLGIPRPNYYKYEDGRKPPAEVLQKIADYGGISVKWLLTGKEEHQEGGGPLLPDQPPVATGPPRPCEIQEYLLAQVLRAVEEFWKDKDPGLEHRARLITALYNYCARSHEPVSFGLVEKFDTDLG